IQWMVSDNVQLAQAERGLALPANLQGFPKIEHPVLRPFAEMLVYQTPYVSKCYDEMRSIIESRIKAVLDREMSVAAAIEEIQRIGDARLTELDQQLQNAGR